MPRDEPDHLVDVHDAAAYLARLRGEPVAPGTVRSAASRGHIGRHGRRRGRTMYDLRELHRWAMMGIMDDLITWLRAQLDARERELDEDERVAREAADYGDVWRADDPGVYPSNESQHPGPIVGGVWGDLEDQYAKHIARWDPARVLAEVATERAEVDAKRRILDLHQPERRRLTLEAEDGNGTVSLGFYVCTTCTPNRTIERGQDFDEFPCLTVKLLALPYADRPGYREEWRPTSTT